MKKILASLLIAIIILNTLLLTPGGFAATMRYYDNVQVERFSERLKQHLSEQPWQDGFLDITKGPYNAKGDGRTDDSDAIQQAIDDAYASNLVVYFPGGTYLVSKQLVLNQYPANWFHQSQGIKFDSQRKFGNILIGSTKGTERPKIVLQDNSTVGANPLLLFRYFDPRAKDADPNDRAKHYLATIRGIDIDMGVNPQSSAVSMDGAQYCTIQDVSISGSSFYAGISKIPGAVGSVINVKVSGGNIGILSDSYVPEALVTGIVLENQQDYGVKILDSRNSPINLVGFKITSLPSPKSNYRAIYVDERGAVEKVGGKQTRAHVTLTDGTIEVKGENTVAIESYNQYVIMKNVYVKANTVIDAGSKNPPVERLNGDKSNWKKISNYAFVPKDNNGYIHVDGVEHANTDADVQYYDVVSNEKPETDFIAKHIWPVKMPSYDDAEKVNIVAYGATADNHEDDDSIAIQKAIDDTASPSSANFGKSVFMPRGHFYVKNTINLKKGTKIFGAGKNISAIQQHQDFKIDGSTFIVDTVNDKNANIVMSDFAILRQEASAAKGLTSSKYVSMLRVRGNDTVFRDIQFAGIEDKQDNYYLNPEVIFSDNAGGKIYNLAVNTNVRAESGGNIHGDYRRVLIDKVTNPLTIYQCGVNNTEKAYMLEIRDSANVTIYAIKFEEQNQLLKIKDSAKIAITGGYGYFTIVDNIDSIITIENSSQIYLAGIGRSSMRKYEERKNKFWLINGQDLLADDYDIIIYKSDQLFPQPKTEELLNDAGLERGAVSWQAIGSATIKEEFNFVHQGSRSIKVAQQKSADNGIAQDITDILQKNGPGNYDVSAWIMKGFDTTTARSSNKKSKAEDSKNDAEKQAAAKALIKIEVKHDGTTEYYTLDDKAFNYWNRVSGSVNLSWKRLESARILIALAEGKTEYYIDEVSLSKQNNVENIKVKRNNNKLPGFLLFLLTAVTVGGALVAYKRFRK